MVGAGYVVTWMLLQPFPVLSCPGDDLSFSPKLLTRPLALWLCLPLPVSGLSLPITLLWEGIHCKTTVWESTYCPVVYEPAQLSGGEYPLQRKIMADGRSFSSLSFALEVGLWVEVRWAVRRARTLLAVSVLYSVGCSCRDCPCFRLEAGRAQTGSERDRFFTFS